MNSTITLTRKEGESVMIGDDTRVTVTQIKGSRIRISFNAPKSTPIYRREIYEEMQKERNK